MLFNSYIFILLFLPLTILGYYLLNHFGKYQLGIVYLLTMSLWFYGYSNIAYLGLIVGSILINYGISSQIRKNRTESSKKRLLILGIAVNIGALFVFKYYNFFISNINNGFKTDFVLHHLVLPLGISFFTFQQISYIMDTYRGETEKSNIIQYAAYVAFFPKISAGPIVLHNELMPQMIDVNNKKLNYTNLSKGLYIFSLGLAKKVLIADSLARIADYGFGTIASLDTSNGLLVILAYTLQIYFDFSGYCDMGIGIGYLFNIKLPINFNSPYKAVNIADFWGRWHMTLTRFFRKYLYIPLGGNRKGAIRTYCNMMIIFLVSGLWHGANWTFILWGGLHGMALVINKIGSKTINRIPKIISWFTTFVFINICWVYFRADSIPKANLLLKNIFKLEFGSLDNIMVENFISIPELEALFLSANNSIKSYGVIAFCFIILIACVTMKNTNEKATCFKGTLGKSITTMILLVWSILSLSGVSAFLYFNF